MVSGNELKGDFPGSVCLNPRPNGARSIEVPSRLIVVTAGTDGRFSSLRLIKKKWVSALDALIRIHLMHVRARPSGGGLSMVK